MVGIPSRDNLDKVVGDRNCHLKILSGRIWRRSTYRFLASLQY